MDNLFRFIYPLATVRESLGSSSYNLFVLTVILASTNICSWTIVTNAMVMGTAIFCSTIGIALCTTRSNRGIASVRLGSCFMVVRADEKADAYLRIDDGVASATSGILTVICSTLSVASFGTVAYALWIRAISWWDWTYNLSRSLANCIYIM